MPYPWLTAAFILSVATNQATFNRGINYHRLGKISDLNRTGGTRVDTYRAVVDGSTLYDCEVKIYDIEDISYSCDCEAALSYTGACKHIIALLYEIKEQGTIIADIESTSASTSIMLERFRGYSTKLPVTSTKPREQLLVEYELLFTTSYGNDVISKVELKLKVGSKRMYVVRDLEEFIQATISQESYIFTPNFSYDPSIHFFSESDLAVFRQIYTHLEIQATERQPYSFRSNQKRLLEIPAISLQPLLDKLTDTSFNYSLEGNIQTDVRVKPLAEQRLLSFSMKESIELENHIELQCSNKLDFYFAEEEFQVLVCENNIYRLNEEQAKQLQIIGELPENGNVIDKIPKEELEAFCSYVLPALQSIGQVEMTDVLQETIETKPLRAKFFLDIDQGILTGRVAFEYGEHTRNPFAEDIKQSLDKIITRDVRREEVILDYLSRTDFDTKQGQLTLTSWEKIIPFLFEELPLLQSYLDVYTSSAVKKVIATPTSTPSVHLDVNQETNWLDLSFSIEGIPEEDIMNVLSALQANIKYYKLSSGAYLQLNHDRFDPMKQVLKSVSSSKQPLTKEMSVPLHKAFEIDREKGYTRVSKKLHQLLADIQSPEFSDWDLPQGLKAQLRDYQINGYCWLRTLAQVGLGGILADDMGLGKTVQTIAFLQAERENRSSFKALIIAPASLIYNWEKEISKFAPNLNVIVVAGTKQMRKDLLDRYNEADIFITSYPLIQRDSDIYEPHLFHSLILDEAQAIKNETTKTTKAVRSIQANSCFALSGTPVENHQDELYSIFHSLLPGMLGTKKQFKDLENEQIAKKVRPFILRRLKKEVLTELPDKMEMVQYTDLSPDQKKMYVAQVKQLTHDVNEAITTNQFQQKRIEILAGLTRLRQICCHPNLVNQDMPYQSGKMERLQEYVEEGLQSGQRMVIFSQFTSMLHIIKKSFDENQWEYHYLDGQTPAKNRVEMAERFNQGEKSLFLISLKAGGTGLNLIGGDTVILYDTWWNPAIEEQAADRVYRYGQTKNVQVVKLIANGTIEEKILDLHERKKALVDAIIQPGEETLQSLSADDIRDLLSYTT
ncbi:DEAD/DEAH box helicase [Halalkalibacter akibai]|uniref:SNF2 helicase associated n=1 Tax=Halalkalibacter akibai (strain ATCC 43226 / DSM 21942 / CIP 109018 / JCM 9157 / 1139) TaxID=1236973 RepID=W4QWY1_HALA3|nr:DEAD/DEAH box helicase [Halalkalibacter akibai]GAE35829.1 SNF2 helicase associated [Halalkalibacter akibai JCM 9157]